jgi:hypothetical protein
VRDEPVFFSPPGHSSDKHIAFLCSFYGSAAADFETRPGLLIRIDRLSNKRDHLPYLIPASLKEDCRLSEEFLVELVASPTNTCHCEWTFWRSSTGDTFFFGKGFKRVP